jgi:hypothetical protein
VQPGEYDEGFGGVLVLGRRIGWVSGGVAGSLSFTRLFFLFSYLLTPAFHIQIIDIAHPENSAMIIHR